jgi:hypothetical protein
MISIGDVISLLGIAAKNWSEPKIITVNPLDSVEDEPSVKEAKAAGKVFRWVSESKIHRRSKDGYQPFYDRDTLLRPRVFMDSKKELLLMVKD